MHTLADGRSLIIKKAENGYTIVVQDHNDCIFEDEKQVDGDEVCKDVSFNEKILQDL